MHKPRIAICVADPSYCEKLVAFLAGEKQRHSEVYVFSDPDVFWGSAERVDFHAALMEEMFFENDRIYTGITRFILMNEGMVAEKWRDFPTIYKYQTVDAILREIYGLIGEYQTEEGIYPSGKELIGVYSPHGHDLQIAFSLGLAEILAEQKRVLYLNFMDCAGFEGLFDETYPTDLGDLLYFARKGGERFYQKLGTMLYKTEHADYVPPAHNPEILHEATKEDYEHLITLLCEKTDYQMIVMDFGAMIPGFAELMQKCEKFYCPISESEINYNRIRHFEQYLSGGGEQLTDKIQYLKLQEQSGQTGGLLRMKQQIFWGEFGETLKRQIFEAGGSYGD